jgi:hypothetical protein
VLINYELVVWYCEFVLLRRFLWSLASSVWAF